MLVLSMTVALLAGILLLTASFAEHLSQGKRSEAEAPDRGDGKLHIFTGGVMILAAVTALAAAFGEGRETILFYLVDRIPVSFRLDDVGRIFLVLTVVIWTAVCFYSFKYMRHEGEEKRFYGFFFLAYAALIALDGASNLITFYFFFEFMTLCSMPLVIGRGGREAVMAALKYLFYSLAGAYLALFGIFILYQSCGSVTFRAGGVLNPALAQQNHRILLVAVFAMLVGFGAKAGMFPLHAWLPTAHPIAPAPASAALSAIIVKCGVLAVIRTVYFIVGPNFLRGTWVQKVWLTLALITVFLGSMLAFLEKGFKKRLAYSTVSQVSYILFGLALFTPQAFAGAILQLLAHALVKCALFMTAGIFILRTGKTQAEDYIGIGKKMGLTLWGYTIASLSLIGIPPTAGFIGKWYLCQGSLDAGLGDLSYLGPAVLLVSAILTAGYLLPVSIRGFLPGREEGDWGPKEREKADLMTLTLWFVTLLSLLIGLFPGRILAFVNGISDAIL